ncbi:hypothetical protein AB0H12_44565 [Actinosynnema sp. NPDC023794]
MSATDNPARFMADPHAVVKEIVVKADPQLDAAVVDQVVMGITLHKPRLRRLGQALQADPDLLTSGRPEGPRMVGQLIGALLAAGSTRVVLPRCAHCGKQNALTSLAADTGHRICGYCAIKQREQVCGRCGRKTAVAYRDRHGTARCQKCPPIDGEDPVTMIVRLLRSLGTGLPVGTLTTLVTGSVPQATQQQRLAWELEDNSSLLTGQGAQARPGCRPCSKSWSSTAHTSSSCPPVRSAANIVPPNTAVTGCAVVTGATSRHGPSRAPTVASPSGSPPALRRARLSATSARAATH